MTGWWWCLGRVCVPSDGPQGHLGTVFFCLVEIGAIVPEAGLVASTAYGDHGSPGGAAS